MVGKWDSNLKRLVQENPQEFVSWLVEGAVVIRDLSVELNREIHVDILYEAELDGEKIVVHIEFQRYEDEDMSWRVLEYNVFATCKYKCPVHSFVLYLKKEGKIAESPLVVKLSYGPEIWRFNFTNVKLWEVPTERLRQMKSVGVLPLLALTREGGQRSVLNEAIAGIEQASASREKQENLLTITFNLATLGFSTPEDLTWLKKRFFMFKDIIKDTEIYQIIAQEGREEGLRKGLEEGRQEGRQEGREEGIELQQRQEIEYLQQTVLSAMQQCFPELLEQATESVNAVSDLGVLRKLASEMIIARTTEQAHDLLEALKKNKGH